MRQLDPFLLQSIANGGKEVRDLVPQVSSRLKALQMAENRLQYALKFYY